MQVAGKVRAQVLRPSYVMQVAGKVRAQVLRPSYVMQVEVKDGRRCYAHRMSCRWRQKCVLRPSCVMRVEARVRAQVLRQSSVMQVEAEVRATPVMCHAGGDTSTGAVATPIVCHASDATPVVCYAGGGPECCVGRCRRAVSRMLRTAHGCDSRRSHRTRRCSTFVAEEEISL